MRRLNDIDRATNAKSQVEQKQREEAKMRKDTNGEWDTKVNGFFFFLINFIYSFYFVQYFKPNGEAWIFTNSLSQRLYLEERNSKR